MPPVSKKRKGVMPSILTEIPGPAARKILERDQKFVSQSYTRVYPLVVKKARGVWVDDVDSNRFLDFTSGIAVCKYGSLPSPRGEGHPAPGRATRFAGSGL